MAKISKKKIIVIINAKTKHVYWAQYTRNKKSIWTGEDTESLIDTQMVRNYIDNLTSIWTFVSDRWKTFEDKNDFNIQNEKIFFPNAKDIIPFVLLKIKNKDFLSCSQNALNYLYNPF